MKVCTHNGKFHSDDVLAYSILSLWNPNVVLVRSRDPKDWDAADIVFDVGMGHFDHHMNDAQGKPYRSNKIPYSSAGLIWKAYGRNCIKSVLAYDSESLTDKQLDIIYNNIDENFILPFDLHDNGISVNCDYAVTIMDFLSSFNPTWEQVGNTDYEYAQFLKAAAVCSQFLRNKIIKVHSGFFIELEVKKQTLPSPNPKLFIINKNVPCNFNDKPEMLFHIFPSGDMWRIRAINIGNSFEVRKRLPAAWAGLDSEALQQLTGVQTARFCHTGLFVAGATTLDDAIKLAEMAIVS